jgi:hypothetical protein
MRLISTFKIQHSTLVFLQPSTFNIFLVVSSTPLNVALSDTAQELGESSEEVVGPIAIYGTCTCLSQPRALNCFTAAGLKNATASIFSDGSSASSCFQHPASEFGPMWLTANMQHIAGHAGCEHELRQILARGSGGDMMRDVAQGRGGGWTDAPNRLML